ncbi:hypothetical protein EJ05DRAFT_536253 [Pseudovirgaria hyperparasitica]|uniref:Restriction endonuclease domain-containing protein n=1 Tax=Pseudovirgaria hyperparasitica TaxID=470096 RepID=A0A6A6WFH2_9PEZI|nr:uncharacterized protein EJ05DRAFT_536253 [Pseudovirgaria hyperparasitica]KAF2761483.1 hypothetical protein EJ05DRAFT_536253 [Pseudovirgaria hyperparasitica]
MALLDLSQQTTPPASIVDGPPTPPLSADAKSSARVVAILCAFKSCQTGYPPSVPWTVYKLDSGEYEELQRRLKDDVELCEYVDDKVRYDYDPVGSRLVIRMPTTLHDTFSSELVADIKKGLENLKENHVETRPFIDKISSVSGAIHFEDDGKKIRHEPDIRFHHEDAAWPGVVIEVSYSQKRKSLIDLADNYILASDGGIRVMIGIDLEYKKSKEASISIWRLKTSPGNDGQPEGEVIQELDNELFRDAEGNPVRSSAGLELPLNNFATQALSDGLPECSVIVCPETLCKLLAKAEKWNDKSTLLQGVKPARIKRKYRQKTPEEQLTVSDEEKVIEEERRTLRKIEKADKSYGDESLSDEASSEEAI